MPPSQVQPQDPSMSPTFSLSTSQAPPPIAPSIRRNLFAGHLSRRPVASGPQNPFGPPSPGRPETQTRSNIFSSSPSLQPTKRTMAYQDIYDPNISPSNAPISPSTSNAMFPKETSIIAVHPVTGRPLLPNIPTLPARLRLNDDEEGEEEEEEEEEGDDEDIELGADYFGRPGFPRSPSFHKDLNLRAGLNVDVEDINMEHEFDVSEFEWKAQNERVDLGLNNFLDLTSEDSQRERERIERLLSEMQARQRDRAKTTLDLSGDGGGAAATTNAAAPSSSSHVAGTGSRSGRFGPTRTRVQPSASPTRFEGSGVGGGGGGGEAGIGGIGPSLDPLERDELMGLIMTSLRRKLYTAEEEGWMYGGAEGLGGIAIGVSGADDTGGYGQ